MSKIKKTGPLSTQEQSFIRLNREKSADWIAEEIGRNVETILKFLNQGDYGNKSDILSLEKREDYKVIKEQFSEAELEIFKSHWYGLTQQFKDEIQYSEAMTLLSAIKQEILANRILSDSRKVELEVARLSKEREDEMDNDPPDVDKLKAIEFQLASYAGAQSANHKAYIELADKLEKTFKALKITREQRLSKVEESKKSFPTWLRMLIEDETVKKQLGSYMEKMRLAAEIEQKRLGSVHLFANNEQDRPFLNSTTVMFEE